MSFNDPINLYYQVREAVHHRWDPIGVAAYSDELGEYDNYIPELCRLLKDGVSRQQIFDYLWVVETDSIGLNGNRQATEEFSFWLYQLVEFEKK